MHWRHSGDQLTFWWEQKDEDPTNEKTTWEQKGRTKLSLLADDLVLFVENPEEATKKLLGYTSSAGCRI